MNLLHSRLKRHFRKHITYAKKERHNAKSRSAQLKNEAELSAAFSQSALTCHHVYPGTPLQQHMLNLRTIHILDSQTNKLGVQASVMLQEGGDDEPSSARTGPVSAQCFRCRQQREKNRQRPIKKKQWALSLSRLHPSTCLQHEVWVRSETDIVRALPVKTHQYLAKDAVRLCTTSTKMFCLQTDEKGTLMVSRTCQKLEHGKVKAKQRTIVSICTTHQQNCP